MKMRKWALLCAALLLLTACSAAPKFDLAAGEIAVAEDLVLGMPMEDVPQAWQQELPPAPTRASTSPAAWRPRHCCSPYTARARRSA